MGQAAEGTRVEVRRRRSNTGTAPPATGRYRRLLTAFSEITKAINDESGIDATLRLVASEMCRVLGVSRCSLYLRDQRDGVFRGQVGHADRDIDAAIKRLIAGGEADGFTREILATHRPVFIADARRDGRPVRQAMTDWGVRAMLGVPMVLRGEVIGLVFLDDEHRLFRCDADDQDLCAALAELAAIAVAQAHLAADLRTTASTVQQQNLLLRRAEAIEHHLTGLVIDGAGPAEIAAAVSERTGKPCAIFDAGLRPVVTGDACRWLGSALLVSATDVAPRGGVIGPVTVDRGRPRLIVAPIGGPAPGWVVLIEHGRRFGAHDLLVARRAALVVALQQATEGRATDAARHGTRAWTRDLLVGELDDVAAVRAASWSGFALDRPHRVAVLRCGGDAGAGDRAALRDALESLGAACEIAGDLVVLLDGAQDMRDHLVERCTAVSGAPWLIAVADPASTPPAYRRRYREALEAATALERHADLARTRTISVRELGAARKWLSSCSPRDAVRFVDETLGPIADPANAALLETLVGYARSDHSVRAVAQALGLHENSVRKRLARIEQLTGLEVTSDPAARGEVQLAALVIGMRDSG